MILQKNQINDVVVTVTEQVTLSSPFFLFEFASDSTNLKFYCIAANTSTFTGRFDSFNITDTSSPNPLTGEVSLPEGEYKYTIYQQASSTNLDPANTSAALYQDYLEIGKTLVQDVSVDPTEYAGAETTNTSYVP